MKITLKVIRNLLLKIYPSVTVIICTLIIGKIWLSKTYDIEFAKQNEQIKDLMQDNQKLQQQINQKDTGVSAQQVQTMFQNERKHIEESLKNFADNEHKKIRNFIEHNMAQLAQQQEHEIQNIQKALGNLEDISKLSHSTSLNNFTNTWAQINQRYHESQPWDDLLHGYNVPDELRIKSPAPHVKLLTDTCKKLSHIFDKDKLNESSWFNIIHIKKVGAEHTNTNAIIELIENGKWADALSQLAAYEGQQDVSNLIQAIKYRMHYESAFEQLKLWKTQLCDTSSPS